METLELALRLLAGLGLILTNGFFVAIEFALTRARQFSEQEFLGDGGNKVHDTNRSALRSQTA